MNLSVEAQITLGNIVLAIELGLATLGRLRSVAPPAHSGHPGRAPQDFRQVAGDGSGSLRTPNEKKEQSMALHVSVNFGEDLNEMEKSILSSIASIVAGDAVAAPAPAATKPPAPAATKPPAKKTAAPAKKAAAKPAPEPEPEEDEEEPEEDGEPTAEDCTERAGEYVAAKRAREVKAVLTDLGVGKVSELDESQFQGFLDALPTLV